MSSDYPRQKSFPSTCWQSALTLLRLLPVVPPQVQILAVTLTLWPGGRNSDCLPSLRGAFLSSTRSAYSREPLFYETAAAFEVILAISNWEGNLIPEVWPNLCLKFHCNCQGLESTEIISNQRRIYDLESHKCRYNSLYCTSQILTCFQLLQRYLTWPDHREDLLALNGGMGRITEKSLCF